MRTRIPILWLAVSLAGAASAHSPALLSSALQSSDQSYAEGLVAVKVVPGKDSAAVTAIKKAGGSVSRSLNQIGWKIVKLPKKVDIGVAMAKLDANDKVFGPVERVPIDHIQGQVNDPLSSQQWSLNRIQLPDAWDLSLGNRNVVVAIVDTGVDAGHPDLTGRVLQGYDFVNNDNNPDDDHSHGTHCAGIAAASTNNGVGIAGGGYNVTILPVKAANAAGQLSAEWEAAGITYAADQGADIISMSFGGFGYSQMVDDAIQYAHDKGSLCVAAAGNNGINQMFYPASLDNVLCVASSDPNDTKSDFSNYGPDWVDVAAPGNAILSTIPRSMGGSNPYAIFSGTSMACPLVAGVASLVVSYAGRGTLSPDEIERYIEDNVDEAPGNYVKFGRVNASKVLQAIGVPVFDDPIAVPPTPYEGNVTYLNGWSTNTDGVTARIQSVKRPGIGLTGSFMTNFTMANMTTDELRSGTLTLGVTADPLATVQVFLQDVSGTWKIYTTQPGKATGRTTDFNLSRATLNQYMTTGGQLNVMVRSFVPVRLMGRAKAITKVDLLRLAFNGIRKPNAAP